MNSLHVDSFERDGDGKVQIYHCTIAGREKALNRKQLLAAIELTLREGPPAKQPAFAEFENGNRAG
jgi:hypothetical protein